MGEVCFTRLAIVLDSSAFANVYVARFCSFVLPLVDSLAISVCLISSVDCNDFQTLLFRITIFLESTRRPGQRMVGLIAGDIYANSRGWKVLEAIFCPLEGWICLRRTWQLVVGASSLLRFLGAIAKSEARNERR